MIVSVSKFLSQGQIVLGNSTHRTRGGGGLLCHWFSDILWHKFSYNILMENKTMPIFLYSMLSINKR